MQFQNRTEAGRVLAREMDAYQGREDLLVLALPRGGVPVAYEVAQALDAPLDVFLVRKLGLPGHEEYALGAIATGGVRVLNEEVLRMVPVPEATVAAVAAQEQNELERRERLYRGERGDPKIEGRTVILVDDGLATGASMRAAIQAVRIQGPGELVVAVPVAPRETCEALEKEVDAVICPYLPEPFQAVGLWYRDFRQTSDREVTELLARSQQGSST